MSPVVLRHHIGDRPPHIPQEAVRLLRAADHASGHHRQKRQRVIAVARAERWREIVGPVLRPHLVAVGDDMLPRLAFGRGHARQQMANVVGEVHGERRAVQLVHFQPGRLRRRGAVLRAGRRSAATRQSSCRASSAL